MGAIVSDYSLRKELMKADGAIKSITLSNLNTKRQTLNFSKLLSRQEGWVIKKIGSEPAKMLGLAWG